MNKQNMCPAFDILNFPLDRLKGVGHKRAKAFSICGVNKLFDLLYFFPKRYVTRASFVDIVDVKSGDDVTILAKVKKIRLVRGRKVFLDCTVYDNTGELKLLFFNPKIWIINELKGNNSFIFWGKVSEYKGKPMLVNPNFEPIINLRDSSGIFPIYPYSRKFKQVGLSSRAINKIVRSAFELSFSALVDPIPVSIRERERIPELKEALRMIHFPLALKEVEKARNRFAFEELFLTQLLFAKRKAETEKELSHCVCNRYELYDKYLEKLSFALTPAQRRVFDEIRLELSSGKRVRRLIQGDVGCGKTVVAMLLALLVVAEGFQVAFMAPTELLAFQHFVRQKEILDKIGVRVSLLTGGLKNKEKKEIFRGLENGLIDIVFGTHSLLSDEVKFKSLGLCIIDEQQRFGVAQRLELLSKAHAAHAILLSATPIPRTLFLALYGDLDLSTIDDHPPKKARVRTFIRPQSKRDAIYNFVRERCNKGEKGYIVFPTIGIENDTTRISLKEGVAFIKKYFKEESFKVIHGRLSSKEKEKIFNEFVYGNLSVLVGTSIVEVGLDVKEATFIVIEGPEYFGLSQLHQLRGRIGRGEKEGYCILILSKPYDSETLSRLARFSETENGFQLAELDLELRGWGDPWGVEQHGFFSFRVADPIKDRGILEKARLYAQDIMSGDIIPQKNEVEIIEGFIDSFANKTKFESLFI